MDQSYASMGAERAGARGESAAGGAPARHDVYRHVHMGLRALMGEVLAAVGRIDLDDARNVTATIGRVNALLALMRSHLSHEDEFILPALEARRPGSSQWNAKEHAEHLQAIEMLDTCARRVQIGIGEARDAAARALYQKLALFVAENLLHMHVEEVENNAVLWAAYSDAELAAIERALIASIPAHRMVELLRAILPAISPIERAQVLEGVRHGAPAAVFEPAILAVRPHLNERDWFKLGAALNRRPVAAEAA